MYNLSNNSQFTYSNQFNYHKHSQKTRKLPLATKNVSFAKKTNASTPN
jgi:hypothetical protein